MRILGIDPGSRVAGWGLLEADGWDLKLAGHGVLRLRADSLAERLLELAIGLRDLIGREGPEVMAVERVFSARGAASALVLGHARGVVLLCAAEAGLPVGEHATAKVKSAVTGYGRAEKAQVQQALATQLGLARLPTPLDASDAIAVAACHAATARLERQTGGSAPTRPRAGRTTVTMVKR